MTGDWREYHALVDDLLGGVQRLLDQYVVVALYATFASVCALMHLVV